MCNRSLREVLWRFFVTQMQERAHVPATGCVFVVDHFADGAYCFDSKGWWLEPTPGNVWGESDLKVPYWLARCVLVRAGACWCVLVRAGGT